MFSPAVGRVARSANTLAAAPANSFVFTRCARSALSTSTAPQQPFRPSHQRRYSSSKPSTPPNSKKKPAELDQNATAELRGAGRRSKETKKLKEPSTATTGNNVPFVPPTNHLREDDVKLSAFFGLHRPISISRSFPSSTSTAEFDAFFDVNRANDVQRMEATKDVLSGFLDRVHAEIDAQEEQRADAIQSEQRIIHVDFQPTKENIEDLAARLVPFQPPPAPDLNDPIYSATESESRSAEDLSASINQRITEVPLPSEQDRPSTFREHVARRRYGMYMISVKRQRKLKMKKHKYKKLMKRTRLLRRKLDRT
ncbi:unnamed protein product [Alternaria alternata]|uniref:Small ribosomal subunit protein mS38 n=3 Tax=Alternaria sect. Alternaria TaxID=2499237 RepID=A0A177DE33_ALTAL|nr:hypothetical protein CC77DRAFT_941628 [Alternaria alternata]XP_028506448.1 hypothetical protein AA0111_g5833 [Alternaria arborescens]XP_051590842.1 uncharacterized protein J4E82_003169 [Alternaria postmessia]RII16653.1 hypothetical protein CUC08_Gglean003096 [Alternaria sp. MG1]RYN25785.1 hypothetical protein AA0115_g7416 [Alternaria tenuissima]KAI5378139.1 hypothetical protein J4E82_003169 [Alternaria postmessia]OAG18015.1 hypothetical protein CC77DRAFT_941628 [Alternaria alternata]OWY42